MSKPLGTAQLKVLEAFAGGTGYGFDVMDQTGLPSGSVYPALSKLEKSGLVRSRWEAATLARREKRPPRRYYEITPDGTRALTEALERLGLLTMPMRQQVVEQG